MFYPVLAMSSTSGLRKAVVAATESLMAAVAADRVALRESMAALSAESDRKNAANAKKIKQMEQVTSTLVAGSEILKKELADKDVELADKNAELEQLRAALAASKRV